MDAKKLFGLAESLFSKKKAMDSWWQEVADNFYPERADFTLRRYLGNDFTGNLMSSYPITCRRDLGNQFSTMLRPTARPWFHTGIRYKEDVDTETKQHLEWFEETQRRAMYDPDAMFTRATKEGDHDFSAFGQCALSAEIVKGNTLLYRCWHLKDMAWQENEIGKIGDVFRKWKTTAQTLYRLFGDKVHADIKRAADKNPFEEFEFTHMRVEAEMFDNDAKGRPYWLIWYDGQHNQLVEAVPTFNKYYIIPRWQTVSGSQYAYSPAVIAGLPDARLIQAMTYTLLEAGEKATSPPILATKNAVRSDIALYAGGITWLDNEYDEKMGAALRPLEQDFRGFNYGVAMNQDTRSLLHKAFFLDTLTMPQRAPEMTAYEVGQRVQEYIRNALPIFEPMEMEYNAAVCDVTFDLLWRGGTFGNPRNWPQSLRGAEIDFHFESPLHDVIEQQKGQKFQEMQQLLASAVSLDQSMAYLPKVEETLRDVLAGVGVPAKWLNTESAVAQSRQQAAAKQQAQEFLNSMQQGSEVVKNIAPAVQQAQGQQQPVAV